MGMFNENERLKAFGEMLLQSVANAIENKQDISKINLEAEILGFQKTFGDLNTLMGSLSEVIYNDKSDFLQKDGESVEDWIERTDVLLEKITETSNSLTADNVVGALLSFPVGDGAALYVVKQESPLVIEHIPHLDAYHAPAVLLKGIDLDYIKNDIKSASRLRSIFSKNRAG